MSKTFTTESARERMTALVRRLVFGRVTNTGSVKAAIGSVSRETGISTAWIERAHQAQRTFAPLLNYYESLCDALEKEIGRQEAKLKSEKLELEAMKNAGVTTLREARTSSSGSRSRAVENRT